MKHSRILVVLVVLALFCQSVAKVAKTPNIESGKLFLQVKQTPTASPQLFQLSYDSSVKSELQLSQSSLIEIEAKMKFGVESFDPQYFTFRLVHSKYDKLTQPVKAIYDADSESWKCIVDFGDPKTIQPYSDLYKLQISIADDKLPQKVRSAIASIRLSFRHSLPEQKIPTNNSPISYIPSSVIRTNPPETRIDPPSTFTIFVVVLMSIVTVLFYYGVFGYLKVNFKLLPSDGLGLLLNLGLIVLLGFNLAFLAKFWLQWNFITTISNFSWLVIVTALIANYALLYLKNRK